MSIYHYHRQILEQYDIRAARMVRRRPVPESLAKVQADAAKLSRKQRAKLLGEISKKHSKAEAERLSTELFPKSAKKPAKGAASETPSVAVETDEVPSQDVEPSESSSEDVETK